MHLQNVAGWFTTETFYGSEVWSLETAGVAISSSRLFLQMAMEPMLVGHGPSQDGNGSWNGGHHIYNRCFPHQGKLQSGNVYCISWTLGC